MENCYLPCKHLFSKVYGNTAKRLPIGILLPALFFFLFTSYSAFAGSTISASATPYNASNSCNATDGSLTVTASGGNGSGQYYWSLSGPNSYTAYNFGSSPVTFSNLPAGNYSVIVQDASNGGADSMQVDQNQPSFYNQEGYVNGISEWQSLIAGKTGLMTDLVIGFSTGPGANNIVSGSGTLSIYAGTGMSGTPLSSQTINISNNNTTSSTLYFDSIHLATPVYVADRQVFTFSLTTGTLTGELWLATGNPYPGACDLVYSGIGSGFGYQWTFRTYVTTPIISNDGYAGSTTATIGATVKCRPITATATPVNATGCDSSNGGLTINVTSGGDSTNNYYFKVSDGSQTASTYGPSGTTISNLQAGTYSITVEDAAVEGIPALDDSVPVGDLTPHPVYNSPGGGNSWQSFLADRNGSLTQIDISFDNNYGNSGYYLTGTLNVYSGLGIGGTLLTTQSGSVLVPGGNNYNHVYADFILSNPVSLTASYEYTFEFKPANLVDSNFYIDQTGSITGGEFFSGSYITGYAMCFNTYVTTAPILDSSITVISQTISNTSLLATVSGNVSVCTGDSTAISASGGNSYSWSPTAGLSCDTCSKPVAKPLETTTYYVTISNSSCSVTDSVVVTVASIAAPVLSANDTLICSSDSAEITTSGNYSSYSWNDGDTSSFTYAKSAGYYWLTVTNSSGCSAVSGQQLISVYPVPSVSIIESGDTLSSYGAISYQWLFNGDSIAGATGPVYVARITGNYSVEITDTNGCKAISSSSNVTISGLASVTNSDLEVFPNPFDNVIRITIKNPATGPLVITLYNLLGEIIITREINAQAAANVSIDVSALPAGAYYLRMGYGNNNEVKKLVKE